MDSLNSEKYVIQDARLETIDEAVKLWLDNLNISVSKNDGFEPVPIFWQTAERAFQSKIDGMRAEDGRIRYPIIYFFRNGNFKKSADMRTSYYADVFPEKDEKGGIVSFSRRINQEKTNIFEGNKLAKTGASFIRKKKSKTIVETLSVPVPVSIEAVYKISVKCDKIQHMNTIMSKFITQGNNSVNFPIFAKNGNMYECWLEGDQADIKEWAEEEDRGFEASMELKVLGYIYNAEKNEERPTIAVRENVVDVKVPRERSSLHEEIRYPSFTTPYTDPVPVPPVPIEPTFTAYNDVIAYLTSETSIFERAIPLYEVGFAGDNSRIVAHYRWDDQTPPAIVKIQSDRQFSTYDEVAAYLTLRGNTFKKPIPLYKKGYEGNDNWIIANFKWSNDAVPVIVPAGEILFSMVTDGGYGIVASNVDGTTITLTAGHTLPASFKAMVWTKSTATERQYNVSATVVGNTLTLASTTGIVAGDVIYALNRSEFTVGNSTRNISLNIGDIVFFTGTGLSVIGMPEINFLPVCKKDKLGSMSASILSGYSIPNASDYVGVGWKLGTEYILGGVCRYNVNMLEYNCIRTGGINFVVGTINGSGASNLVREFTISHLVALSWYRQTFVSNCVISSGGQVALNMAGTAFWDAKVALGANGGAIFSSIIAF